MRIINTQCRKDPRRCTTVARSRSLLILAGAVVLLVGQSGAFAEEPDASTKIYAEKLAVTVCGSCHGTRGNSIAPKFPRLAGQNANYLITQLKAFRSQTRGDPDAVGYMWGMAGELDDATIDALARYYAAQKPEPSAAARSSELAGRGRAIYEQGVATEGVPACSSCHGPDGHGLQDFPRLAGQHAQYVLKQLGSFQSNMRNVAIMHGVAQNLRMTEMQQVAAYLETQP